MLRDDRRNPNNHALRDQRIERALDIIERAQHFVSRAAEELCPVAGFGGEWQATLKLYDNVKEHWHRVSERRDELASSRPALTNDGRGQRYILAGRPVHAGDTLEFDEGDGWTRARFEWTHRLDDVPELHLADGTARPVPNDALFRWPKP